MEEFSDRQLMEMEKETTGLYVSGHPLSRYQWVTDKYHLSTVQQLYDGVEEGDPRFRDRENIGILCLVQSKKLITTKNGQTMAFVTMEDMTGTSRSAGSVPNTLYANIRRWSWTEGKHLCRCPGEPFLCDDGKGAKDLMQPSDRGRKFFLRQPGPNQLHPPSVQNRQVQKPESGKEDKLYIKLKSMSDSRLGQVLKILEVCPGKQPSASVF